jgi:hypothetical protein
MTVVVRDEPAMGKSRQVEAVGFRAAGTGFGVA